MQAFSACFMKFCLALNNYNLSYFNAICQFRPYEKKCFPTYFLFQEAS